MTVSANIKLLRLEMETLTHNGAQCGHVPYYPSSIAIQGLGDSPGKEGSMRLLFSEVMKTPNATKSLRSTDA